MTVTIDCTGIHSREDLHQALAEALSFPQWYGKNLDALYDCLTAICEDTRVTLLHSAQLGSFARGFQAVFADAQNRNPHLHITFC